MVLINPEKMDEIILNLKIATFFFSAKSASVFTKLSLDF